MHGFALHARDSESAQIVVRFVVRTATHRSRELCVRFVSFSLTSHPFIIRKKLSIEKASFHKRIIFSSQLLKRFLFFFRNSLSFFWRRDFLGLLSLLVCVAKRSSPRAEKEVDRRARIFHTTSAHDICHSMDPSGGIRADAGNLPTSRRAIERNSRETKRRTDVEDDSEDDESEGDEVNIDEDSDDDEEDMADKHEMKDALNDVDESDDDSESEDEKKS